MSSTPHAQTLSVSDLTESHLSGRLPADIDRLRALARRVVRDAAAADDVVQDAVVAAMTRGGGAVGAGWWTSAVRSLAVDRFRSSRARERREAAYAKRGASPSAAETVERAESARELYDALLALPEPTRDVVLLRFIDGLPPREIATRLDLPVPTVKKRLERGLAGLRQELERRGGGDGRWAVALLPLAGRDVLAPVATSSVFVGGAAALLLAGGGVALGLRGMESDDEAAGETTIEAGVAPSGDTEELAQLETDLRRESVGSAAERPEPTPAVTVADTAGSEPAAMAPGLELRLIDADGRPMPGIRLSWDGELRGEGIRKVLGLDTAEPLQLESDAEGVVRSGSVLDQDWLTNSLSVESPGLLLLGDGVDSSGRRVGLVVPTVRLEGVVIDPDSGEPIPNAKVSAEASVGAITTLTESYDFPYADRSANTTTDEQGRFLLNAAPTHRDFVLAVIRPEINAIEAHPVPATDQLDMRVAATSIRGRVDKARTAKSGAYGRVVFADGSPCPDAVVSVGNREAMTDATGSFFLSGPLGDGPLIARRKGPLFVVGPAVSREESRQVGGAGPFLLTLPESMDRLMAQVVDAEGRPRAGLQVYLVTATSPNNSTWTLEKPLRGGREYDASCADVTDARGIVGFRDVARGEHELLVVDKATRASQRFTGLSSERRVSRLVFEPETDSRTIEGEVVDAHGRPLAGAEVEVMLTIRGGRAPGLRSRIDGVITQTDEDGRFTLPGVPVTGGFLDAAAKDATGGIRGRYHWSRPLDEVSDSLRIEINMLCEVVLQTARPLNELDAVAFEDAAGERIVVTKIGPNVHSDTRAVERRANGAFPLVEAPQTASVLVLLKGDEEVGRVGLRLDPDEREQVDF